MDANADEFYISLSEKKNELIDSDSWDADDLTGDSEESVDPEEQRRQQAIRYAIRLYKPWDDSNDTTYREVADVIDEYSKSWVSNRVREWKDGEHRDLVADPTDTTAGQ
jgi:hypothetical protein